MRFIETPVTVRNKKLVLVEAFSDRDPDGADPTEIYFVDPLTGAALEGFGDQLTEAEWARIVPEGC